VSEEAEGRGEHLHYQSYLLRLWKVNEGEEGWQASLESVHSGERRGFADVRLSPAADGLELIRAREKGVIIRIYPTVF
jgi:hypothetical protein